MKLNYKRTILVGFAFFLISAFWGAYDAIVPLALTNHFGLLQSATGVIMSLDNILAVFMLPIFGALSDRVNTKRGRRTPFILFGTIAAVISFIALTFVDNYQLARIGEAGIPERWAAASNLTGEAAEAAKAALAEEALNITLSNPWPLILFIAVLLCTLIAMATFRSPAVALMPDVTPKPLRSKGNAIINLMGTAGGIIILSFGMIFGTAKDAHMKFTGYVVAVCAVMALGLLVFMLTVKEKKWAEEMHEISVLHSIEENAEESPVSQKGALSKPERMSLVLILISVALWYIGYNSITSRYSVYATNILGFDYNITLIIAQAAAVVAFIPAGIIASKIGRRKTILIGITVLAASFGAATFITASSPELLMYIVFVTAGIGWATINVNSFPMVVELAKAGDVGKYTGYYYTASMSAQIVAPVLSGVLIDIGWLGWKIFFPFATLFVSAALITMYFVKHGDGKAEKVSALEALGAGED